MKISANHFSLSIFLIVLAAILLACATATKQPSLYDTQPDLLSKQYPPDEITAIEQGFEVNPLRYSQELGNLLLWKMNQKSPEFALEFAQTPELNDGIDEKEATAMVSIYNLIECLDIPVNLFEEKEIDQGIHKIIMEWQGDSKANTDWSGYFYHMHRGEVLEAKPIGFEPGEDEFDHEYWLKNHRPRWKSIVKAGDTDGIAVTFKYPYNNRLIFEINDQMLVFTREELPLQSHLSFVGTKGIQGTLIIRNVSENDLSPELHTLRDIVMAGENDYRYSAPLQALLWGYMDGKFKEGDDPFENYVNIVNFVKPIWGKMEGPRWKDFNTVINRLNKPELINYFEKQNLRYEYYRGDWKTNKSVFKSKLANCKDTTQFSVECLRRAGYKAGDLLVSVGEGHNICYYWDKDKLYLIDNANPKKGILGPYNSFRQIPYHIEEFL